MNYLEMYFINFVIPNPLKLNTISIRAWVYILLVYLAFKINRSIHIVNKIKVISWHQFLYHSILKSNYLYTYLVFTVTLKYLDTISLHHVFRGRGQLKVKDLPKGA